MDRQSYFDNQLVTPQDLNALQDNIEKLENSLALDHLGVGIVLGLELVQTLPVPGLTLDVLPGVARDPLGRRLAISSRTTVDLSVDMNSRPTAVAPGNKRMILVAARFKRIEEHPYNDPIGGRGFFDLRESLELLVVAGDEVPVGNESTPALPAHAVQLGGVVRQSDTTQFLSHQVLRVRSPAMRTQELWQRDLQRNLECIPTNPPSLKAVVTAGRMIVDSVAVVVTTPQESPLVATPVHGSRIDLVYLQANGVVGIRTGEERVNPERPSTAGVMPVAFLRLDVGQDAIEWQHIEDARPWLRAVTSVARVHSFTALGGETEIGLPFAITPGANSVEVMVEGSVLRPDQYVEATDTIVLSTVLRSGQHVVVRAENEATIGIPANHARLHAPEGADPLSGLALTQIEDDLSGVLVGGDTLFTPQGDASRKQVVISPIACVVIGRKRFSSAQVTITDAHLEGGGSFAANAWLYVYAYDLAGVLAFQFSTTAPEAGRVWKNGTRTHRYLGCVVTDGTTLRAFRMHKGVYRWRYSETSGPARLFGVGGTGFTTLSLSRGVPPHARMAQLGLRISNASGAVRVVNVRTKGDSFEGVAVRVPVHAGDAELPWNVEIETDSAQEIEYKHDAGTNVRYTFDVLGFSE